jgi:Zinc finger, C2H2 type
MLACDQKRQHNHLFAHLSSPSLYNSHLTLPHGLPYSTSTPSPSDFNGRLPQSFYEPTPTIEAASNFTSPTSATSQYMSGTYSFPQNPAIRVQDATPTPAYPLAAGFSQQMTPVDNHAYSSNNSLWSTFDGGNQNARMVATGTPALQTSVLNRRNRPHQRAPSSSSIGSAGSSSPFSQGHATSYPSYVSESSPSMNTASKNIQSFGLDGSRTYAHHLPTPTQTPTQDSFIPQTYPAYSHQHSQSVDSATAASMAMNRAMLDATAGEEDVPGMSHSGRHSISSMGQEPSTPHTVAADGFDDGFKVPSHGETTLRSVDDWLETCLQFPDDADNIVQRQMVPKLDRTMSDVYQDELYNPGSSTAAMAPSIPKSNPSFLSPFRNKTVSDALQAAQFARSQSPISQASRGVSPFRPESPYVNDVSNEQRLQAATRAQVETKAGSDRMDISHHSSPRQEGSRPTTISPKDAVLEYHADEDDPMGNVALFPDHSQSGFDQQQYGRQNYPNAGQATQFPQADPPFGTFATSASRLRGWPDASRQIPAHNSHFSTAPATSTQQQQFSFATPTTPAYSRANYPFTNQSYRQTSNMPSKMEETPEFPAHLTSMESSASEAPPSTNNSAAKQLHAQNTSAPSPEIKKPAGKASLADTGTYTCTYHGCSLRFETPQKLQKHKREGHRQQSTQAPLTTGVGSGMTSAALHARNSQAGPHKCERTNPTTGKPCNTVFSRPYDLTRHEDTIHNSKKQKVRCALCVEEKTFSRNDALTRHMRVVHPEVDFPGKHRRRGAND